MLGAVATVAEMAARGLGLEPDAFTSRMRHAPHLLAPTGEHSTRGCSLPGLCRAPAAPSELPGAQQVMASVGLSLLPAALPSGCTKRCTALPTVLALSRWQGATCRRMARRAPCTPDSTTT